MQYAYFGGFVGTWIVLHFRGGFSDAGHDWREILLSSPLRFIVTTVQIFLWPVTLIAWIVNGGSKGSAWRALSELDGRKVQKIVRTQDSVINCLLS